MPATLQPPPDTDPSAELERLRRRLAQIEGQWEQLQRLAAVGTLASTVTHEFNNILTTVINYAKLGLRHQDKANRDKAFDRILAAGHRATRITQGLLNCVRSKPGRKEIRPLVDLVQDILVLVEKDLSSHKVQWQMDRQGEPTAAVNSGQIQQVLLNLMVNARQAMPEGGRLFILVSERDGFGEITIRDTGAGIPPEVLPRIFEPFFTTKPTDTAGQGGTGLGLSLCQEIIESHQGRIRVESSLGQGTAFTIRLPLAIGNQSAALQIA